MPNCSCYEHNRSGWYEYANGKGRCCWSRTTARRCDLCCPEACGCTLAEKETDRKRERERIVCNRLLFYFGIRAFKEDSLCWFRFVPQRVGIELGVSPVAVILSLSPLQSPSVGWSIWKSRKSTFNWQMSESLISMVRSQKFWRENKISKLWSFQAVSFFETNGSRFR